jgi:redox-sensitive bicupin YhaK (pirin superfamily)
MKSIRKIRKIFKGKPTIEGAGVHLKRVFGFYRVPQLDPFLLLDDFRSNSPKDYLSGFPWHPHRGIETITYMLNGSVEHGDSLGSRGITSAGGVQWMTAGKGIIHQEMPKGDSEGRMGGFQLWANLPASHKMMDPRYREVKKEEFPEIKQDNGITIKIIAGMIHGVSGPVKDIVIEPEYLDITMPPQETFVHPVRPGHAVFTYVIDGAAYFDKERDCFSYEVEGRNYFDMERNSLVSKESLALYDDGEQVEIVSGDQGARFLLVSGKPLNEPVAWYGPIVMNTQEELKLAFEEYRNGIFIKHRR